MGLASEWRSNVVLEGDSGEKAQAPQAEMLILLVDDIAVIIVS